MNKINKMIAIEGNGIMWRGFQAQKERLNGDGLPVGAISGMASSLTSLLDRHLTGVSNPKYMTIAFDHSREGTFRKRLYPDYKAQRPSMPAELLQQKHDCMFLASLYGLRIMEDPLYEADDLVASASRLANDNGIHCVIMSPDKDCLQLQTDLVRVFNPVKRRFVTDEEIRESFGGTGILVAESQALSGDKSDNIPGVPGIGPKTASWLISNYNSLEGVYENIYEIKKTKGKKRIGENLEKFRTEAHLSKELTQLKKDIDIELADCEAFNPDIDGIVEFLAEKGLNDQAHFIRRKYLTTS